MFLLLQIVGFLMLTVIKVFINIMFVVYLLTGSVTRNEKFLASIASGKWVLHKSYFEACRQEQRFVEVIIVEGSVSIFI